MELGIAKTSSIRGKTKQEVSELKKECFTRVKNNGERAVDVCKALGVSKTFLYSALKEEEEVFNERDYTYKLASKIANAERVVTDTQEKLRVLLEEFFPLCEKLNISIGGFDHLKPLLEGYDGEDELLVPNDGEDELLVPDPDPTPQNECDNTPKRGRKKKAVK